MGHMISLYIIIDDYYNGVGAEAFGSMQNSFSNATELEYISCCFSSCGGGGGLLHHQNLTLPLKKN